MYFLLIKQQWSIFSDKYVNIYFFFSFPAKANPLRYFFSSFEILKTALGNEICKKICKITPVPVGPPVAPPGYQRGHAALYSLAVPQDYVPEEKNRNSGKEKCIIVLSYISKTKHSSRLSFEGSSTSGQEPFKTHQETLYINCSSHQPETYVSTNNGGKLNNSSRSRTEATLLLLSPRFKPPCETTLSGLSV